MSLKKTKKNIKNFLKIELWNLIRNFDSKLPNEVRTSLFIAFCLLRTLVWSVFWREMLFWINIFTKKKILIWRKISLKVNKIMPNIQCSLKISILDNSSKQSKFKNVLLVQNSTMNQFFNDTTPISLRWIYRSAKIVWTKKNSFEYSSSPHKWVRNKNFLFRLSGRIM